MTVTARCLREAKHAENAETTQYTAAPGVRAIIDKFSVTNTSAGAEQLTVSVVPSGGSVAASNRIAVVSVPAGEAVSLAALAGQVINAGGFISTLASAATALVIRISGREVT